MKYKTIKAKDIRGNYTYTVDVKDTEPITIDSMEKIWKEAKIVPYKFIPTGEIVYFTPEIAFKMEAERKSFSPEKGKK